MWQETLCLCAGLERKSTKQIFANTKSSIELLDLCFGLQLKWGHWTIFQAARALLEARPYPDNTIGAKILTAQSRLAERILKECPRGVLVLAGPGGNSILVNRRQNFFYCTNSTHFSRSEFCCAV